MTPEQLAPILYTREVEYAGIKATPWDGLHESHRRKWYVLAEAALAATFATPKPSEGWPEGFTLAAVEMTPIGDPAREWFARLEYHRKALGGVYGATREEATERARLIAHTLANGAPVQPASTVNHDAEIERLKTALRIAEAGNRGREDTIKGLERERDEARAAEADAQQRRQRVKAIAMDLAGELADVRLAELTGRIEGADE